MLPQLLLLHFLICLASRGALKLWFNSIIPARVARVRHHHTGVGYRNHVSHARHVERFPKRLLPLLSSRVVVLDLADMIYVCYRKSSSPLFVRSLITSPRYDAGTHKSNEYLNIP